jgi:hypothetical protein
MSALVWSAMSSMEAVTGSCRVRPMPALSNITTRWCPASACTSRGSQPSMVRP